MTNRKRFGCLAIFLIVGCGVFDKKKHNCPTDQDNIPPPVSRVIQETDIIYGQEIPRSESFYVDSGRIFDRGHEIQLKGVNWFGFETGTLMLHGLWTGRTIESFVDQVKGLGFNAWRIPLAPEALTDPTARSTLERFLSVTEDAGMYVLLDLHNCSNRNSHMAKPGPAKGECGFYSVDKFLADMRELAKISAEHKKVVGIDLFNEPYGYGWDEWARLSEKAGEVILKTNPRTLVFVEGVADKSSWGNYHPFWGENLYEGETKPVKVPFTRLVYSPHVYGPSVAGQIYFNTPDFPRNMPQIWEEKWGKLAGKFPLVIGEFGGRYQGSDRVWADAFVDYLIKIKVRDFFYWSLNPNSGDTGGILLDDWRTVNPDKMALIKRLMDN